MSFTSDTGDPPQHDFPEVGSYIEIAFAFERKKAKVIRHSRLVIQLDNGFTIPFHAVHWWRPVEDKKEKITLELYEEMPLDKQLVRAKCGMDDCVFMGAGYCESYAYAINIHKVNPEDKYPSCITYRKKKE